MGLWSSAAPLRDRPFGRVIEVPEANLTTALRRLGALGHCVEPASAVAMVGLQLASEEGIVNSDAVSVCVITSSGLNWTERTWLKSSESACFRVASDQAVRPRASAAGALVEHPQQRRRRAPVSDGHLLVDRQADDARQLALRRLRDEA